jgi:hypothetical protein
MGFAFRASSTSSVGACRVCGFDSSTTFAACLTETVGPFVDVVAEELCAALSFVSLTFGSLPAVAAPRGGVEATLLDDGTSAMAELGATSAPDGGTDPSVTL